jgi:hypothetical protein
MQMRKFKQFSLTIGCIFTLFASSFAACVCCSHHEEQIQTEASSSHHHSEDHETSFENIGKTDPVNESATRIVSEQECRCLQPTTLKTGAKSETVKLKTHLAALPEKTAPETIVSLPKMISVKVNFAKPLYLSDSFYNLAPGRAPPVL